MADKRFGVKELIVLGSGTPTISTISSPGDLNLNANNIGINSTQPTVELDVNGKVALGSSVYDSNGNTGTSGQVLSSVPGVGVSWTDQTSGSGGSGGSSDPVGTIVAWAGSVASIPSEYQLCDGSTAQTSELQAITGTYVPDLRDRFIIGATDGGDGTYPGIGVGSTGGSANAVLVAHSHAISPTKVLSTEGLDNVKLTGATSGTPLDYFTSTGSNTVGKDNTGANSTSQTGTNANLPPYYALCYIIKHTAGSGGTTTKIAILQDKKTSGTDGGTFTSGAWQDRTLNTETDPESIVGGMPNIFILQAGNYKINWSAPAHAVDSHQSKLLYANNISFTSSSEVLGSSEACHDPLLEGNNNIQTRSFGETILTLTQATFLKIQHRCTDTKSNTGFGVASNFGVDEVYTQVVIQDLSSSGGSGGTSGTDTFVTGAGFSSITGGTRLTLTRNQSQPDITADLTLSGIGGTDKFTGLSDTPADYTNSGGKLVAVNSGASELEFIDASGIGTDNYVNSVSFGSGTLTLGRTGSLPNLTTTINLAGIGGTDKFTGLTDTPSNYSGDGGKIVGVNSTADGLEFINASTIAGTTYTLVASGNPSAATITLTGSDSTADPVTITAGNNIFFHTISDSGFTIASTGIGSTGGSGIGTIFVKQYANDNNPRTEYSCSNPINVITSAGITTIGIGSTSNAFGKRYVGTTEPTSDVCDGDIWYDTSSSSSSSSDGGFVTGMIMMFSGTTAPTGWVLCDNSAEAQAANAPDLRDRFIVGTGNSYNLNDIGGSSTVALTEAQMPQHNHGAANSKNNVVRYTGTSSGFPNIGPGVPSTYKIEFTTVGGGGDTNKGNGDAHENRPPYYALAFIMKT